MADLNALPLADLTKLQKDIAKAIANFDTRQKSGAMAALEEKAREFEFKLAELVGLTEKTVRNRKPSIPKYRNPSDPAMTWSGIGRRPMWFTKAMESGKKPSDLEIPAR